MMDITTTEQNIEKRLKRNEDIIRDLWNNIKHTNIHILVVPGGEEREREIGPEKIIEEITTELFPNMGKEMVNQVQEA